MKNNNDFYKLSDITEPELKRIYTEKAMKMYGVNPNDAESYNRIENADIVMPKENSKLYNQIKNSEAFQKWIAENYDKIKSGELKDSSFAFPEKGLTLDDLDLFATIHRTDVKNSKINEDGSLSLVLMIFMTLIK